MQQTKETSMKVVEDFITFLKEHPDLSSKFKIHHDLAREFVNSRAYRNRIVHDGWEKGNFFSAGYMDIDTLKKHAKDNDHAILIVDRDDIEEELNDLEALEWDMDYIIDAIVNEDPYDFCRGRLSGICEDSIISYNHDEEEDEDFEY